MHPFACQTHTRWHMSVSCHQSLIQVVCQQKLKKIPCCIDVFLRIKSLNHGSTWIIVLWAPIHQTIQIPISLPAICRSCHRARRNPMAPRSAWCAAAMDRSPGAWWRAVPACAAKSPSASRISLDVSQQGKNCKKNVENSLNSNESNHECEATLNIPSDIIRTNLLRSFARSRAWNLPRSGMHWPSP